MTSRASRATASERRQVIVTAARELAESEGWESVTRAGWQTASNTANRSLQPFRRKDAIVTAVALEDTANDDPVARARHKAVRPNPKDEQCHCLCGVARANPALYEAMFVLRIDLRFAQSDTPAQVHASFVELRMRWRRWLVVATSTL